jgi:hypothetical protein
MNKRWPRSRGHCLVGHAKEQLDAVARRAHGDSYAATVPFGVVVLCDAKGRIHWTYEPSRLALRDNSHVTRRLCVRAYTS